MKDIPIACPRCKNMLHAVPNTLLNNWRTCGGCVSAWHVTVTEVDGGRLVMLRTERMGAPMQHQLAHHCTACPESRSDALYLGTLPMCQRCFDRARKNGTTLAGASVEALASARLRLNGDLERAVDSIWKGVPT